MSGVGVGGKSYNNNSVTCKVAFTAVRQARIRYVTILGSVFVARQIIVVHVISICLTCIYIRLS